MIVLAHKYVHMYTVSLGPYPSNSIHNASVVNFYNATGSLARFENNFFILL
jgi:hypothetical protein